MNPVESTPSAHPGTLDAKSTKTDGCEKKKESGRQRRAPTSIEEYKSSSLTGCSVGETENCTDFARSANLLLMYFGRDGMWKRRERREMFFYQRQPFASLSLNSSCHFCHLFLHDFMELDFNRIISRMSCFPLELQQIDVNARAVNAVNTRAATANCNCATVNARVATVKCVNSLSLMIIRDSPLSLHNVKSVR